MDSKKKKKDQEKRKRNKPLTFGNMSFEEAMSDLLKVTPPDSARKKPKK